MVVARVEGSPSPGFSSEAVAGETKPAAEAAIGCGVADGQQI